MYDSEYWIERLKMIKHPEGGYYKEIYKNNELISDKELTVSFEGSRPLATSIYFLLTSRDVSHFHRLKSDEIWYFHAGSPLSIYVIDSEGELKEHKLGLNLENGEQPQIVVPGGSIFGSLIYDKKSYSLVGCMVSHGFDFRDFELFTREELLRDYPQHEEIIRRLT